MTSRLDNFEGLDVEYIRYLEEIVLSLRNRLGTNEPQGRQGDLNTAHLRLARDTSSGDVEHDISRNITADNTSDVSAPEYHSHPSTVRKRSRRATHEILKFIPYDPHDVQRKVDSVPQWRRPAQELIRETPVAENWMSKLQETGLYQAMENNRALAFLLDTTVTPDMSANERSVSDETIDHIRQYAQAAAMRSIKASVALKLANFQKLLVLSACAVLLSEGYNEEEVLDAAKLCIGTSIDDGYCKRLVQSSKFVNRLIDNLNIQGWGYRASELLILWNRPPSWYFSLASYATASLQYLTDKLCTADLTDSNGHRLGSTPWTALFVPSMVCHILRNKFSVESISQILGYKNAYLLRVRKNTWKLQRSQNNLEQQQE